MQSLLFFNKEGDNLNIKYSDNNQRWEGDLIFHENGNDTFKTIGLYTFEKISSFEYENPGQLALDKFQLFNEYKFIFNGCTQSYFNQAITKIEPVNIDSSFYSKWIWGDGFDTKYPVGSNIIFDNPIFEFGTNKKTYTVLQTKKNAILIISNIDNDAFMTQYGSIMSLTQSYVNSTISGINTIGIYNYIKPNLRNNLSSWSEPSFYDKLYNNKKLNVINTNKNDGVYTINNTELFDQVYYKYELNPISFTQSDLLIEIVTKTDTPLIYNGNLTINSNKIYFTSIQPTILKPGTEFVIANSVLNNNLIIDNIPSFSGINTTTFFDINSQVIWNNKIKECIQAYTWSATENIDPDNNLYWSEPTYLPLISSNNEVVLNANVHLTTNKIYYTQAFTYSIETTLACAADKYKSDFQYYNIDLYYDNKLVSELIYPDKYVEVNYYAGTIGLNYSNSIKVYQKLIGVNETLKQEINKDTNSNFNYNIVFTDLDQFGLIITINGEPYEQEIQWFYNGLVPDMARTINSTLKSWLSKWFLRLNSLGIIASVAQTGDIYSIWYNTINLKTEYPNVPLKFSVLVGTTANYYIDHTRIIFQDMSNYLLININGRSYGQSVVLNAGIPNITLALTNWVDTYDNILSDYGIYVTRVNNMLRFNTKEQDTRLDIEIKTGKSNLPGIEQWSSIKKFYGHFGSLITSNEVVLPSDSQDSFEAQPFATGQIISINNTPYPYVNVEYNILYLNPHNIVLSYQGPFWGTTGSCTISPYVNIAFTNGFGATACPPVSSTYSVLGQFDNLAYNDAFLISTTAVNTYNLNVFSINENNLIDIMYLPLTEKIYVFGEDITVFDALDMSISNTIYLGSTASFKAVFNPINDYIYYLGLNNIWIVDPLINTLVSTITLGSISSDCEINTINGDVYVTYTNSQKIDIWDSSNMTSIPNNMLTTAGNTLELEFNPVEGDMYVKQDDDTLLRIDGLTRTVQVSYLIPGLTASLYYEPINSSIFLFDNNNMIVLNNGSTQSTTITTKTFNNVVYNNTVDEMCISQTNEWNRTDLSGNLVSNITTVYNGDLFISQWDGDVYMASRVSSQVLIFDSNYGIVKHQETFTSQIDKMVYNPIRKSMIGLQSIDKNLIEIISILGEHIQNSFTASSINDSMYGTLSPDYVEHSDIWLAAREYLRRPRENYEGDVSVKYIWKWLDDTIDDIFLYDFSGDQLVQTGSYSYIGEKPLPLIALNRNPNKNINYVSLPQYQQTIFDEVLYTLDYVDSNTNYSYLPEPMETFIGFRSDNEGVVKSTLLLMKREDINFYITTTSVNDDILEFRYVSDYERGDYGVILLNANSTSIFTYDGNNNSRGLKPGQLLQVFLTDMSNTKNKFYSKNDGSIFRIRNVYTRYIVVDFINTRIFDEFTKIDEYPNELSTTYLRTEFKIVDKEIGRFEIYGQTEIEDIRYKIELSNNGQAINEEDIYIFKSYDINEQGVDWGYMNRKRKEMLEVRHDIFPYIGSYKSIINAINYFGYNDLELYEYYRNIDINSPDYFKLYKVEIPDIFDNTVEGWKINDFLKHTMPNSSYEDTNLFNLTYRITDKEGNNVLMYSLREVIIKLQGLKKWLHTNIIPITHKILDITGQADFVGNTNISHRSIGALNFETIQNMTPVDFRLNEAYLMPVNSTSTVYTCHVDFYVAGTVSNYFSIKVRTWKTYKEWNPFTTYNIGDKVEYYGNLYESVINDNRVYNPRKYINNGNWSVDYNYVLGDIINYKGYVYEYIGTQSSFGSTFSNLETPLYNITNNATASWLDITQWKVLKWTPVQTLTEWRTATHSFNFTVDTNIDPFVSIEVTSDNGYGQVWSGRKNYEIRGISDLSGPIRYIENIGPFEPIKQI